MQSETEEFQDAVDEYDMVAHWADAEGDKNGAVTRSEAWKLFNKYCGGHWESRQRGRAAHKAK